jgi:hypothetical protein
LFQWRYSDVGEECEAFLGPNGYRYVQVSPPHEHIEGPQWWTDYQVGLVRKEKKNYVMEIEKNQNIYPVTMND